ncbi:Retrovirus-related Pol polyprotein from type-2 retrotransposable element R2DM-like Protein [Tribolium castaneum]|uniref:Retrovirus-related Pol polyprotein from type-2 retrotransposable element R2DM-like Protein n=1 Tax=Tribolium castaneum TaxID=7070 RepID=A0A139W8Y6_TRICA|nr:Retrovirus-related Pol polyprotein from type-2 retrotransposable element R2DM-like Protein [Tribolium castaneum]
MHLLRVFFLPKFYHAWTFGRLNAGVLCRLDVVVRTSVRTWLRLPHDIPVGYFHAPTKSGGLGIPQLSRFIPFLRLKRFDRLGRSAVDYVRESAFTDIVDQKIRWCRERLSGIVDQVAGGRDALDAYWTAQLHQSVDGRALRESASVASSTQWLRCSTRAIPASDWLHYTAVHIGALPSRVRTSCGRRGGQDVSCRGLPPHRGRVLRHDAIAKRISADLMELGWIVTRQVSFRTTAGVFRPDMVAVKEGVTVILDVQIVSPAPTLDEAHRRKVAKYRNRADLARYLAEAAVARGRARLRIYDLPARPSLGETCGVLSRWGPARAGALRSALQSLYNDVTLRFMEKLGAVQCIHGLSDGSWTRRRESSEARKSAVMLLWFYHLWGHRSSRFPRVS